VRAPFPTTALLVAVAALLATVAARAAPSAVPVSSAAPATPPPAGSRPALAPGDLAEDAFGDRDRLRTEITFMLLASAGLMPRAGLGAGLSAGFRWRWMAASLEGRVLATPSFEYASDRSASTLIGMGILSACWIYPSELPFHLYSLDLCALGGAGRLLIRPDLGTGVRVEAAHPFMALVGVRLAASWQRWRSVYFKAFLELDVNPLITHVSYNGDTIFGHSINANLGGVLGFQLALVGAQPHSWFQRIPNPDAQYRP
jgi:hypothetical protein